MFKTGTNEPCKAGTFPYMFKASTNGLKANYVAGSLSNNITKYILTGRQPACRKPAAGHFASEGQS